MTFDSLCYMMGCAYDMRIYVQQ